MQNVDYTKGLQDYRLSRQMGMNLMNPVRRATPATALMKTLAGYFAGKGMQQGQAGMTAGDQADRDTRALDLSRALGAYRGDTPYPQSESETFPGEAPIPGLRTEGTGQNPMAMAQALMGGKNEQLQNVGLGAMLQTPTDNTDKRITGYLQARERGLLGDDVSFADYIKLANPDTNISIGEGPKLPTGYQWADPNDTSKGVIPITGSDKDPTVKNKSDFNKLNLVSQKVSGALDRYEAVLNKHGTKVLPGPEKMVVKTAYNDLMLQLKELFNLGVLNGPDLEIMNSYVEDPTTGMAAFYEAVGGMEGFNNQLKLVRDKVQSEIKINRNILQGGDRQETIDNPTPEQYKSLPVGASYIYDGETFIKGQ